MIEELFESVVANIREYVNRNRTEKQDDVENFLNNILKRLNFLQHEGELEVLKARLLREMKKFSKNVLKKYVYHFIIIKILFFYLF